MSNTYTLYIVGTEESSKLLIPYVKSYIKTYPKKYTVSYCIQDSLHYFQVETASNYLYIEDKNILAIIALATEYNQQMLIIQLCDQGTLSDIINENLLYKFNVSVTAENSVTGFPINSNYLLR